MENEVKRDFLDIFYEYMSRFHYDPLKREDVDALLKEARRAVGEFEENIFKDDFGFLVTLRLVGGEKCRVAIPKLPGTCWFHSTSGDENV